MELSQLRQKLDVQTAAEMAGRALLDAPLPVVSALEGILPGLARGTTVQVRGLGATSLSLALCAKASQDGTFLAAVGMPPAGLLAGHELGIVLDRVVVVPDPKEAFADVMAALVDAFDLVLVDGSVARGPSRSVAGGPSRSVAGGPSRSVRKLAARVRERKAVLMVLGDWPERADLVVRGTAARWHGIGQGHGHLRARELDVSVSGRGSASRVRRATLWLPGPDGEIGRVDPFATRRQAPRVVALGGR